MSNIWTDRVAKFSHQPDPPKPPNHASVTRLCISGRIPPSEHHFGFRVGRFFQFGRLLLSPSYEDINEGADFMELWTDNNNNNNNNTNSNFTSEMMLSDDDMNNNNNNNWERLPAIESRSAECEESYGGVLESGQSESAGKKDRMMMMMKSTDFNSSCQVSVCQVDGCKMDLSSSKYYHQRHRVCVDHSKTSKAMVHGVEQRFCQQCSRFHLLAEFDDDKRSCRKRLACYNERRRKPRFHTHWDASLLESPLFLFPEILSGNYFNFCQEQENKMTRNNRRGISILSSHDAGNLVEMLSSVQEPSGGENSGSAFSLLSTQTRTDHHPDSNLGIYHEAQTIKSNDSMNYYSKKGFKASPEMSEPTIDLQQLSTHLRRVEQQRSSSVQVVSQEIMSSNNVLCCFTTR